MAIRPEILALGKNKSTSGIRPEILALGKNKQPQSQYTPEQQKNLDMYKKTTDTLWDIPGKINRQLAKTVGFNSDSDYDIAKSLADQGKKNNPLDVTVEGFKRKYAPKTLAKGAINTATFAPTPLALTKLKFLAKAPGVVKGGLGVAGEAGKYGLANYATSKLEGKSNEDALKNAKSGALITGGMLGTGRVLGKGIDMAQKAGLKSFLSKRFGEGVTDMVMGNKSKGIKGDILLTGKYKGANFKPEGDVGKEIIDTITNADKTLGKSVGLAKARSLRLNNKTPIDVKSVLKKVGEAKKKYETIPDSTYRNVLKKLTTQKGNAKSVKTLKDASRIKNEMDDLLNSVYNKEAVPGAQLKSGEQGAKGIRGIFADAYKSKMSPQYKKANDLAHSFKSLLGENSAKLRKGLNEDKVYQLSHSVVKPGQDASIKRLQEIDKILGTIKKEGVTEKLVGKQVSDALVPLKGYDIHHTSDIMGVPYRFISPTMARRLRSKEMHKLLSEGKSEEVAKHIGSKLSTNVFKTQHILDKALKKVILLGASTKGNK